MSAAQPKEPRNPFPASDRERWAMWEMLIKRDFVSFLAGDWSAMAADFSSEGFFGIDARGSADPAMWTLAYPTVESYRDEWLRQSERFRQYEFDGRHKLDFLFATGRLARIEFNGDRALAHKKFNGVALTVDGQDVVFQFQSIFHLNRTGGVWKIAGFIGYLPNPMG